MKAVAAITLASSLGFGASGVRVRRRNRFELRCRGYRARRAHRCGRRPDALPPRAAAGPEDSRLRSRGSTNGCDRVGFLRRALQRGRNTRRRIRCRRRRHGRFRRRHRRRPRRRHRAAVPAAASSSRARRMAADSRATTSRLRASRAMARSTRRSRAAARRRSRSTSPMASATTICTRSRSRPTARSLSRAVRRLRAATSSRSRGFSTAASATWRSIRPASSRSDSRRLNRARKTTTRRASRIDSQGRILVAGTSSAGAPPTNTAQFGVARLLGNGALDTTFNGTGYTTIAFDPGTGLSNAVAMNVALLADGGVLVSGYANTAPYAAVTNMDVAAARLGGDGTLDAAFANGGASADSVRSAIERLRCRDRCDRAAGPQHRARRNRARRFDAVRDRGARDAGWNARSRVSERRGSRIYDLGLATPGTQAFTGVSLQGTDILAGGIASFRSRNAAAARRVRRAPDERSDSAVDRYDL